MEKQIKNVVDIPTTKERVSQLLSNPLCLKDEQYDPKDIALFIKKQSGLDRDFTSTEIIYILSTCKEKGLNPMKGEISFFKTKAGTIQAVPKYTTQLHVLKQEVKEKVIHLGFDSDIYLNEKTEEGVAEYIEYFKLEGSDEIRRRSYKAYAGDGKCNNGLVRMMLLKQASQQFIRTFYPELSLGYDDEELQTFDSGYKQNKPKDARVIDVEVKAKSVDKLAKELENGK